jgi:histidyl-tRNA synthetase
MSKAATQPARGMRDFLPGDVRRRRFVIQTIASVYERYGFEPLETPAVENLETLLGKYGDEGNQLVFRILKRGADFVRTMDAWRQEERDRDRMAQAEALAAADLGGAPLTVRRVRYPELADLALRYDLTVPLARVVAENRTLPKFFKRYQIQPVWRADRPARGRFREFYQCDVDALGSTSPSVEAELCGAAAEALQKLTFADFRIRLNHRQLLRSLLNRAGYPEALHGPALVIVDKLDKIGREGVERELSDMEVVSPELSEALRAGKGVKNLLDFLQHERTFETTEAWLEGDQDGAVAIDNLRRIVALAQSTPAAGRVSLDLTLARGLSYYTGAIMEIDVPDLAGSLGGGGRYDNLVGMFLGQSVPACGFSLGLERILVVMGERGMFPADLDTAAADVMVLQWSDDSQADALALAGELRTAAADGGPAPRVVLYPEVEKPGKQFKYAESIGVRVAALVGEDEAKAGTVNLKDLKNRAQVTVPRAEAPAEIRRLLAASK